MLGIQPKIASVSRSECMRLFGVFLPLLMIMCLIYRLIELECVKLQGVGQMFT